MDYSLAPIYETKTRDELIEIGIQLKDGKDGTTFTLD